VRVRTTTAAFEHYAPAPSATTKRTRSASRKESPGAQACKAGNSKSCNEIGDRLSVKYAYREAHQWYLTSCERVRSAMEPTATRLIGISQDFKQLGGGRSDETSTANRSRMAELKNDAAEIKARIQGCFDVGEALKLDAELKQSLAYYEAVCEFSTLIEAVNEAVPGLQHVTESGCTAAQSTRAALTNPTQFKPEMFVHLTKPPAKPAAAAKQNKAAQNKAAQSDEGMVFNESDL
jgi:hypothetical protein